MGHGRKVSHIPVCEKWNDGDEHEGRVSAVEANLPESLWREANKEGRLISWRELMKLSSSNPSSEAE